MKTKLIVNANIVNEGKVQPGDVLVRGQLIEKIGSHLTDDADQVIDARGNYLLPGAIDDQVHFREPGLTHKATIYTEARAAVAGGVTSFMEMPNTVPNTLTQELLENKYAIGAKTSLANYSFFMGASNDNIEEVLKTDRRSVCGVKIFMGSSTGNMLVDNRKVLENLFSKVDMLIATHCEDEATIRANTEKFRAEYGENVPIEAHPLIRSEEACYLSSSFAVELAKKHGTKLHVLHISTGRETALFDNSVPLEKKRITAEACIHHLWFSDEDYTSKGTLIKWNPAVKKASDRDQIWKALLENKIDVIATDHAPHTLEEKQGSYFKAPSGGPLVQHSMVAMLEKHREGRISVEKMVEKMCHNPAILFQIDRRGFVREGYFADLVIADTNNRWMVDKSNVLAKCGWSPFEGQIFHSKIDTVLVSGHLAYHKGEFDETKKGERILFSRD